jgi:hypothetical protein
MFGAGQEASEAFGFSAEAREPRVEKWRENTAMGQLARDSRPTQARERVSAAINCPF